MEIMSDMSPHIPSGYCTEEGEGEGERESVCLEEYRSKYQRWLNCGQIETALYYAERIYAETQ
ncbi:hypothetical protein KIPB_016466, partial [Kipferlia bialata]|eukprot:g16466.t1